MHHQPNADPNGEVFFNGVPQNTPFDSSSQPMMMMPVRVQSTDNSGPPHGTKTRPLLLLFAPRPLVNAPLSWPGPAEESPPAGLVPELLVFKAQQNYLKWGRAPPTGLGLRGFYPI